MSKKLCFAVIVVLVLFSASAFADTVVGTAAGGWRSWVAGNINENGIPYWDGNSSDSASQATIGNYLLNTGYFAGGSGPGVAYDYWGTTTGGSDPFSMDWISGSNNVALKVEVSDYATGNEFGYFDGSYHPLFTGGAAAGDSATFTPTADYVWYLKNQPGDIFKSNMSNGDAYQHFAIFKEVEGVFYLGMEDLLSNSDMDYNDMIVKVSQVSGDVPVPEPNILFLLGSGLIGVLGLRRIFRG